jgi:NAD(P)H dehydrogenase (quinone)
MLNVLVVYDSKTGNTETMAQAIARGVKKAAASSLEMKKASKVENSDLLKADVIIVGSPTYYGLMSASVKAMFDRSIEIHGKLEGKVGAAFTSSGGTASGAETTILSILESMLVHGMVVQGRHQSKHYGAAAVGSPDENELRLCEELGQRTVELALKLQRKT